LQKEGIRDQYIVMVGGAPTSLGWSKEIGADGYGENATEAVRVAKELMTRKRSRPAAQEPAAVAPVTAGGEGAGTGGALQAAAAD